MSEKRTLKIDDRVSAEGREERKKEKNAPPPPQLLLNDQLLNLNPNPLLQRLPSPPRSPTHHRRPQSRIVVWCFSRDGGGEGTEDEHACVAEEFV